MSRSLVLAGGGHAHVEVLRQLAQRLDSALRVTLVNAEPHAPYSGMLPGLIAGHYSWPDCHINLVALCRRAGARLVIGRVVGVDSKARSLLLDGMDPVPWDLLSLNTGSVPSLSSVEGAIRFAIPIKPMSGFLSALQRIIETRERSPDRLMAVLVVGAGAAGVEVALALRHRLGGSGGPSLHVTLAGEQLLDGYPPPVVRSVRRALAKGRVDLMEGPRATRVTDSSVLFSDGKEVPAHFTVWTTGASAPKWIAASGLATDAGGFLAVDPFLRSWSDASVFAAGDVASLEPPVAKAGVYAVREAPVLARNLLAAFNGTPLAPYVPQSHFLSLISLGSRRAVASFGPVGFEGSLIWRLKDHIDRKFMRRYLSE